MIGLIGLGDLGTQLALQILASGQRIIMYDQDPEAELTMNGGAVDKSLKIKLTTAQNAIRTTNIEEVLHASEIVHMAIPSSELTNIPEVKKATMLLHDSVMTNSKNAISLRKDKERFVFVHCLMNPALRVKVANDNGDFAQATAHMEAIGLHPEVTNVADHDKLMARTQGVFALLISKGIGTELALAHENGDLTPSAEELYHAVAHRESNWTEATLKSILSNPYLEAFSKELGHIR